jgi:hypothetical protein
MEEKRRGGSTGSTPLSPARFGNDSLLFYTYFHLLKIKMLLLNNQAICKEDKTLFINLLTKRRESAGKNEESRIQRYLNASE